WYDDATTTTAIASSQDLQTGTYYVSTYSGNCESVRQPIQVDVAAPVASPTGSTHQKFLFAATIDDLVMNEQGVQWYADYDDALTQSNELSGTTSLVDGASYFGILVDTNDCGSEPIEVEVEIDLLNNSSFDLSKLVYYPNPVVSELTIEYKDKIRSVTIYNLLGQQVFNHKYDVTNISIDLSAFTAGTYIVKLETSTETQYVKIFKQ